ncbi:phytanoyl-CoA dioxygenase domain-containing protein 1-like [Arctopsyche grandis]|uniref:phytanoyl-CoA dioxygenase domain-containing protein 1-like n=1 Tax=Arctopsyche grandis TaxID=121162 RepID=UPI00406D7AFC
MKYNNFVHTRGNKMGKHIEEQMEEDGVVVLEGFFTPEEADELKKAGEELERNKPENENGIFTAVETNGDEISTDKKTQNRDMYFLESSDKIRYFLETENNDGKPRLNKVGHALHWHHPLFKFYTFSNRVKKTCLALGMKDPSVVQSMYIYKSAHSGGEVKPHQDATYLLTEPETAIGFWIALDDATIDNGCLWVAKGSHKSGVHRRFLRNPDNKSDEFLIYDRPLPMYPSSNFMPLPISKGDCILLHGRLVHRSNANKSDKDRPAYTFHVVEKTAKYCEDNWLQEGSEAPFVSLYVTHQMQ